MEGVSINLIKITKKPTANINHNGERLNVFPLTLRNRQGCQLSPFQFNILLETPTSEIMEGKKGRKEKRNEGRTREDKESKGI